MEAGMAKARAARARVAEMATQAALRETWAAVNGALNSRRPVARGVHIRGSRPDCALGAFNLDDSHLRQEGTQAFRGRSGGTIREGVHVDTGQLVLDHGPGSDCCQVGSRRDKGHSIDIGDRAHVDRDGLVGRGAGEVDEIARPIHLERRQVARRFFGCRGDHRREVLCELLVACSASRHRATSTTSPSRPRAGAPLEPSATRGVQRPCVTAFGAPDKPVRAVAWPHVASSDVAGCRGE
eukprot:scaffold58654_cov29-Tisochrysis_lutea.AAC.2